MRKTFVISSMMGGGAERVASILLNHWAESGDDVTLVTFDDGTESRYVLDKRILRVGLGMLAPSAGLFDAVRRNLSRLRALRAAIQSSQPDVVLSFLDTTNTTTLLALMGSRIPVVISERNDPRTHAIGATWDLLRRRVYPTAQALVVQTRSVRSWAAACFPNLPAHVIPNPVLAPDAKGREHDPKAQIVMAAGRLARQKGFDILIEVFARIAHAHPEWKLVIHGEGAEREALARLAACLDIGSRVEFAGWTEDLSTAYEHASVFALSSRHEGFPNVLGEAMARGVPVVAFACPSGPEEMVRDGVDGFLIPPGDTAAFATRLSELMASLSVRAAMGARAAEVSSRFSKATVLETWDRLLETLVRKVGAS